MNSEYQPGFKAWLFSIFLAAGFGSLGAEGIKYLVIEITKTNATLELRDKYCKTTGKFGCDYYFENTGDKTAFVTRAEIDGVPHPRFYTNTAVEISEEDMKKPVKRADVAIASPNKMLLISLSLKKRADRKGSVLLQW